MANALGKHQFVVDKAHLIVINLTLHFGKIPRFFIAPVKSEEQFSRDRPTRTAVPNLLGTRDQKKICPWTGGRCGSGSNSSDKEQQTKLLSLTPATLRAIHLLLCSPVPNRPWDQYGSSARGLGTSKQGDQLNHRMCQVYLALLDIAKMQSKVLTLRSTFIDLLSVVGFLVSLHLIKAFYSYKFFIFIS